MKYHIQMKVSTVLEMLGTKRETNQLVKMFELEPAEIRRQCEELIKQGKLYLPTEGCTTEEPSGKCLGHKQEVTA